nr:uncharacterized protein LOC123572284 [Macaca fascicularis]
MSGSLPRGSPHATTEKAARIPRAAASGQVRAPRPPGPPRLWPAGGSARPPRGPTWRGPGRQPVGRRRALPGTQQRAPVVIRRGGKRPGRGTSKSQVIKINLIEKMCRLKIWIETHKYIFKVKIQSFKSLLHWLAAALTAPVRLTRLCPIPQAPNGGRRILGARVGPLGQQQWSREAGGETEDGTR